MTNPTMSFCADIAPCVPDCWQAAKNGMPSRTTMRKNTCFLRYVQFAARIGFWLSLNRSALHRAANHFSVPLVLYARHALRSVSAVPMVARPVPASRAGKASQPARMNNCVSGTLGVTVRADASLRRSRSGGRQTTFRSICNSGGRPGIAIAASRRVFAAIVAFRSARFQTQVACACPKSDPACAQAQSEGSRADLSDKVLSAIRLA